MKQLMVICAATLSAAVLLVGCQSLPENGSTVQRTATSAAIGGFLGRCIVSPRTVRIAKKIF